MNFLALVSAIVGGIVGAAIWAIVACCFHIEIGYVAWAIGGLVGLGAYILGGRGYPSGAVCAGIALVSIFSGKLTAVSMALEDQSYRQVYAFLAPQAQEFVGLKSERQYAEFMIRFGHTEVQSVDGIPAEQLQKFSALVVPLLRRLGEEQPLFDEWKQDPAVQVYVHMRTAHISAPHVVFGGLNLIDVIFIVLGVGTAFRGGRGEKKEGEQVVRADSIDVRWQGTPGHELSQ